MAIERKKPIAFDEVMEETEEVAPEAAAPEMAEEMAAAPEGETATLDLAMLGGQKVAPGDVVRLEVVSSSDEDGTVVVKYASPKTGGIAKASAAFNEGP